MDKLDDFLKYSILFLYYRELFSKKQKEYLELYLEENSTLSEIAEKYNVTRQAVFDNIKRGFKQLDDYEKKLGIFEKEKELKEKLNANLVIKYAIQNYKLDRNKFEITHDNKIDNLKNNQKPKNIIDFLKKELNLTTKESIEICVEIYEKNKDYRSENIEKNIKKQKN